METTTTKGFLVNTLRRISGHMVKAVAAGAVLVAAALPLAEATAASAATAPSITSVVVSNAAASGNYFGQGASGTMTLTGSFAADGSTVTVTSNAPGVTFSGASEAAGGTTATVNFSSSATTVPGFYSLTIADSGGTSAALANAFYVNAAPTVTSVSPATLVQGTSATTITVTGTGFSNVGAAAFSATVNSTVDGTALQVASVTYVSSTSFTMSVTPQNATLANGSVTPGGYAVTVVNSDGGTSTSASVLTVSAFGLSSASPSYIALPGSAASTTTITLTGVNLGTSGALQVNKTGDPVGTYNSWLGVPTFTNTSITVALTVPASTLAQTLDFTYTNSSGNTAKLVGAVGIGMASTAPGNAPTITSVSNVGPLGMTSAATILISGTGFVPTGATGATTAAFTVTGTATASGFNCSSLNVTSTTSAICTITSGTITTSTYAGGQDLTVTSGTLSSSPFANAVTIAGPVITASSPSVLGVGNTNPVLTLTGTGFPTTGTTTAVMTGLSVGATNVVSVSSSTSATVTVTGNVTGAVTISLQNTGTTKSPAFSISAGTAVTVSTFTYPGTTTGVGQGASGVLVTINGGGFMPGAVVSFSAASGLSASVVSVTPTSIVAKVSATATAFSAPATVTNTNGGTGTSAGNLLVNAGPAGSTAISASPGSVRTGATVTLTLTPGTAGNFATGVAVTSSNSLLTVGTIVLNANGTLSVPVTAVAMTGGSTIGVTLTVTNPDGGTGSLGVNITPAMTVTGSYYVPTFSSNLQMVITGTGFQKGMTVASSNADYSVVLGAVNPAVAPSTTSTAILVVSTTSAATAGTSSNITFTNPDGGTVTFTLNGGPAPTPVVKATFKVIRCVGYALTGRTRTMTILGTGFYGQPRVTSNVAGVRVGVVHDSGTALTIRVTTSARTPRGIHVFTVRLANGMAASLKYNQR